MKSLLSLTFVSICTTQPDGRTRLLATLNNSANELPQAEFLKAVDALMTLYKRNDINVRFYLRQDSDNHIDLDDSIGSFDIACEAVPAVRADVAYELASMGVQLSGFTAKQLEEANQRAEQKCLLIWCLEDILQQADDDGIENFSSEQAMEVLQKIKEDHDASVGCNRHVISNLIGNVAG